MWCAAQVTGDGSVIACADGDERVSCPLSVVDGPRVHGAGHSAWTSSCQSGCASRRDLGADALTSAESWTGSSSQKKSMLDFALLREQRLWSISVGSREHLVDRDTWHRVSTVLASDAGV